MKRVHIDMDVLAGWENLNLALYKAARHKSFRTDVAIFMADADSRLRCLQQQLMDGTLSLGRFRTFRIRDPKPRKIVAVPFELRVVHHAIMNLAGPCLEKSQIFNSYACLPGKGVHKAARRVQQGLRRRNWYIKIDIEHYFENLSHDLLKNKLVMRFKGTRFLDLLHGIIDAYAEKPGKGIPIGSLTSQYFANFFLEKFDRFLEQLPESAYYCRYMDDMIWFTKDKSDAWSSLEKAVAVLAKEDLNIKPAYQIQPCRPGVSYCGYRILPFLLLLSRRKKRGYRNGLKTWQKKWETGQISALKLQQGHDALLGTMTGTRSRGFRQSVLNGIEFMEV